MKDHGAKVFKNKSKLKKLLKLAKTNKYSAPRLAKIFSCNNKTILGTIKRFGVCLSNLGKFTKRYSCNDAFFAKLNPISAYWLGFVAADGCLYFKDKSKNFYIGLQYSDLKHLKNFKKAIKSNSKISYIKSNNSAHLGFYSSDKIFDSLVRLGITPNKSLNIKNVKVPNNLAPCFIRGVFDGDGWVAGRDRSHLQLGIAGNKPFLNNIRNTLIKKCNVNKVKIYKLYPRTNKAHKLQYTGYQIFRILDWLYKNSTTQTRLERKYKKYLYLKNKYSSRYKKWMGKEKLLS